MLPHRCHIADFFLGQVHEFSCHPIVGIASGISPMYEVVNIPAYTQPCNTNPFDKRFFTDRIIDVIDDAG
jgi:hypothetical protein